jgi:hypothetical protein
MTRIAIFVGLLITTGCTGVFEVPEDTGARTCETVDDCRDTEICFNNYCIYSGCQTTCTPNEGHCQNGQAVKCIIDQNGCPIWKEPETCGGNEVCIDGQCVEKGNCQDECQTGATSCSTDGRSALTCEMGADLCMHFTVAQTCGPNQACASGQCACENPCQSGNSMCGPNSGEMRCMGPDNDGCYYWGQEEPCGSNQQCTNGQCTCYDPCQIGNQSCGPNGGEIRCQGPDADGCYTWGTEEACIADMECLPSHNRCMPNTPEHCFSVNECRYYGEKLCEDSFHYRLCIVDPQTGCLYWEPG